VDRFVKCFDTTPFNPWLNTLDIGEIIQNLLEQIGKLFNIHLKIKRTNDKIFNNLISIECLNTH
jgi:hypothetical protein